MNDSENRVKQRIAILGSTGSIGVSTLDVVARHPLRFEVFALSAASRVDLMLQQCVRFKPVFAVMASEPHGRALEQKCRELNLTTRILWGPAAITMIAAHELVDVVMA